MIKTLILRSTVESADLKNKIEKVTKYKRLRSLRCFQMVHDMLAYGYPAPAVADFIIKQGEYDGVCKRTIVERLKRYRREILPVDTLVLRMPHVVISAKKQYTDKLEDLRRLDNQYEAMLYRFDLAHARERETGIVDPNLDKIGKSILDLVKTMHGVKMDLGISGQRHLGTLVVTPEKIESIRQKYGEGAAKAMADPVSRARVLSYLKAAEDAALNFSKDGAIDIESGNTPIDENTELVNENAEELPSRRILIGKMNRDKDI